MFCIIYLTLMALDSFFFTLLSTVALSTGRFRFLIFFLRNEGKFGKMQGITFEFNTAFLKSFVTLYPFSSSKILFLQEQNAVHILRHF